MPNPVIGKYFRHLSCETDWIVKIIKHCYRGNDFCSVLRGRSKATSRKEITNQLYIVRIKLLEFRASRINAYASDASSRIGLQGGCIIRSDVQHSIAGF